MGLAVSLKDRLSGVGYLVTVNAVGLAISAFDPTFFQHSCVCLRSNTGDVVFVFDVSEDQFLQDFALAVGWFPAHLSFPPSFSFMALRFASRPVDNSNSCLFGVMRHIDQHFHSEHYTKQMAKLSDLVSAFASFDVDTSGTLSLFSRRLREAGRVSKAKRGRGAASMTYIDAARFLIALGATDHPARVQEVEPFFSRALPYCRPSALDELPDWLREILRDDKPLDEAVAYLIKHIWHVESSDVSKTWLEIDRANGAASIRMGRSELFFSQPKMRALHLADDLVDDFENQEDFDDRFDEAARESATYATGKAIKATFYVGILMKLQQLIAEGEREDGRTIPAPGK
ncbi:MAG: hypothetical protein AAF291_02135 [Pseudomonadota bacterium]